MNKSLRGEEGGFLLAYDATVAFQIRKRSNPFYLECCNVLSMFINIMSAFFLHQSPARVQIIHSRGGLFWCKKNLHVDTNKMNIYLNKPPIASFWGLFATKYTAICR